MMDNKSNFDKTLKILGDLIENFSNNEAKVSLENLLMKIQLLSLIEKVKLLGFDTATCGKLRKSLKIQIDKDKKLKQIINNTTISELYSLLKDGFNSFEDSKQDFLSQISLIESSVLIEMNKFKQLINYEDNNIKRLMNELETKNKELYKLQYAEELVSDDDACLSNDDKNLYSKIKIEIEQKKNSVLNAINDIKLKIYRIASQKIDLSTINIDDLGIGKKLEFTGSTDGLNLDGVVLSIPKQLELENLKNVKDLKLPEMINGISYSDELTEFTDGLNLDELVLSFPKQLELENLKNTKDLKLPEMISGSLNLHDLTDIELPKLIEINDYQNVQVKPLMFDDLFLSSDNNLIRNVLLEEYIMSSISTMTFLEYIKNNYPMYEDIIKYEETILYRNTLISKYYLEYYSTLEDKGNAISVEDFAQNMFGWNTYSIEDKIAKNKKIG